MNRMKRSLSVFVLSLVTTFVFGQITGVQTIPGSYASIEAAVTALNTSGVGTGGATFNIAAGYTETPTTSLILTIATNSPTAANPLVFQKSGAGANPLITAFTPGVSTTVDGIFVLNGVDYVTINGIDLQENAANTTATMQMEWGYSLVKTSGTNGASYNTIKNCTVTLNKTNTASVGIYLGNHTSLVTTALTVTSANGTSSNNKFYNNSVLNCYTGISITGYGSAAPYDMYDQSNEIGVDGVSTRRNQVQNYGGAALTANGIFAINQNGLKIFNTYINNNGGAGSTGTLNGIFTSTGLNSNVDIYNDTLTLTGNSVSGSLLYGINNTMGGTGAGNTVNIYNNVVDGCTYPTNTTGEFRGISTTSTASYSNMYGNKATNNSIAGTGPFSGIYYGGSSATLCLTVNLYNNTISNNTHGGTGGTFYCFNASASVNTMNFYGNIFSNNINSASSGSTYGYYNFAFVYNENIYNNTITALAGGTGETVVLDVRSGSGPTNKQVYGNTISGISGNAGAASVGAIRLDYGTICNAYNNNVYDITNNSTTGGSPAVFGIAVGSNVATQVAVYNNYISDLKAPSASNTTAIYGVWFQGSTVSFLSAMYNTVYMNATSSGANFGTGALVCTNTFPVSIDLRNNILVNVSTPTGTGTTKVIVRASAVITNYASTSGYNCLYAGVPSATNLIYFDGTNSDQTLQAFKNRVGAREQSSFSSIPPFVNAVTTPYNLHLQNSIATQCEGGGWPIAGYTTDYDGNVRNVTTPDVGADEISGITTDIASPNIQYTPLGNSSVAPTRALTSFATITDPSGINTTIGTRPRLYYKKSTNANTYVDNTSGTDSWKYVEAGNTSSPFNFTINYALLFGGGGVVAGDIIQYFVVAQDLNGTPIVGINNGGFTVQPTSVNLAAANFPLNNTINQYTIINVALSGTINVGPAELITSLTNAGGIFQAINASSLSGNLTINITGDLTAETGTFPLNQWAEEGLGGYTVSIVPSAAVTRNIYGSNAAAALIRFDGADRVNIDGRFGGTGTYLMFRNTSNAAPTIGYLNDAQNNTLQYSIIESGNTATSTTLGGEIWIGATTGVNGNDNITISNCEIRDRSDVAGTSAIGINCVGTNGALSQYNNNINISNNNIHDWFLANSASNFGVNIGVGCTGSTISGNSFYQTTTRTHTVNGGVMRAIIINNTATVNSNGGNTINGNFIGGSAPGATGADMVLTSSAAVSHTFGAISVVTGLIPNSIQNNVVRKIDFTMSPSAAATVFFGINLGQGIHNVGNITGNTIGDPSVTGSIKVTINTGAAVSGFIAGILCATTSGSYNIQNNVISGFTLSGTTTSATIPQWIQLQGTPVSASIVTGNTIGSTTTANSIQYNGATGSYVAFAIRHLTNSGAGATITNNIIQNITDNSPNASSADYGILIISTVGSSGTMNVNGNTIRDISMAASPTTPVLGNLGVSFQGFGGTTHSINNNIIAGLNCSNTGAFQNYVTAIQVQGSSCGGTMNQNRIFDIRNQNTGANPGLVGIYISAGLNWTISNNMISLSNGANSNVMDLEGIVDVMAQNTSLKLYYNSIFLGGSTASGAMISNCYGRYGNTNVTLKDNLFYNKRTGGTGVHVALANFSATPSIGWTGASSNYNAFVLSDTTKVGIWNITNYNMSGWRGISGGDANSIWETSTTVSSAALFVNANTGNLHINTSTYPEALATPIAGIAVDYDNNARSATFPTIGADELACSAIAFSVASQTNITCNGSTNGSATVSGTGGNGITYSWAPSGGTTATATGLAAGTYTCTVTNICGNTGNVTVTITQPTALSAGTMQTNVSCNAGTNGDAMVMVSGGTAPYTYNWTPSGGSGSMAMGLGAGTYTCTITDANSCTLTQSFTITEPVALAATVSQIDVTCNGGSNGSATVTMSGGTSPYTYAWSPSGGTAATASGLTAGGYTCTITDANSCTYTQTFTINEASTLSLTSSQTDILCNGGSNGDAMVTVSGGTPSYTYNWTPSGGTSAMASGLTAGTYTCTIDDANACTITQTFTITEPSALAATVSQNDVLCNGGTGDATVTVTGGTGAYTYSWSSGGTAMTETGLLAGTYTCTITDANSCTMTQTVTITEPTAIATSATQVNVSCNGLSDGSIDLTVTGGTGPYTFDWNSGAFTTEDLSGIPAGTYSGVLTDANGCTDSGTIIITEPAVLAASLTSTTDPTSCGGTDGTVDITITGGTTAYTFLWSNSATTEDLSAVGAGTYSCMVTDANGCSTTINAVLTDPTGPTVTVTLAVDTVCAADGTYTLSGGSPAGGAYSGTGVTAGTFNPATASAGWNIISYSYTDFNGCTGVMSDSVYVSACVGIIESSFNGKNFTIMPNPNNGTFAFQLNTNAAADVMIYDALGQLVSTMKVQPHVQQQMNLEVSGVYMITVVTADGHRSTQRVIVNR